MVLLGDVAEVEAHFGPFGDSANLVSVYLEMVLVLVQHRCMVCAKCIIGSEIILDTPDGSPM